MKNKQKKTQSDKQHTEVVTKGQIRDLNSRTVFKDPVLCAQFLRDYVDIPLLKNVQPEDIEDVSEKYQAYLGIAFETDSVKQILIRNHEEYFRVFVISLMEHKSKVDYDVSMQLLRYMVCIWNEYAREMQRNGTGNHKNKSFQYPPILPIVYYEGAEEWTVGLQLKDRIMMGDIFGEYIPDFSYKLIRTYDYSNEELLDKEDEMSLLMMINKVQTPEEMEDFLNSHQDKIRSILKKASEPALEVIASAVWSLCVKMNMSQEKAEACVEKVRERQMGYWFESMERMDIQIERKIRREMSKEIEEAQKEVQEAQKEVQEAQNEVKEAQKEAEEAQREAEEAQKEAEEAQKEAEQAQKEAEEAKKAAEEATQEKYRVIVSLCQEFGDTKEAVALKLMKKCDINKEIAIEKVNEYWKE